MNLLKMIITLASFALPLNGFAQGSGIGGTVYLSHLLIGAIPKENSEVLIDDSAITPNVLTLPSNSSRDLEAMSGWKAPSGKRISFEVKNYSNVLFGNYEIEFRSIHGGTDRDGNSFLSKVIIFTRSATLYFGASLKIQSKVISEFEIANHGHTRQAAILDVSIIFSRGANKETRHLFVLVDALGEITLLNAE